MSDLIYGSISSAVAIILSTIITEITASSRVSLLAASLRRHAHIDEPASPSTAAASMA